MISPSPPHSSKKKPQPPSDSAQLHANYLKNQFARDTSSDDIERSPSLTKKDPNINSQQPLNQLRQHSLYRDQLERKNRETLSKIENYQDEQQIGITRILPVAVDQTTYGTNSTFKRDSLAGMPMGIHEVSQGMDNSYGGKLPSRDITAPVEHQ